MMMKTELKKEKAKSVVLPLSKFGLMQITRQRVRPEMNIETKEGCPSCQGTGKVEASILIIDEIEQKLSQASQNYNNIILKVHPFVASYITQGWFKTIRRDWSRKFGCKLTIEEDTTYHMLQYRFLNNERKVIRS